MTHAKVYRYYQLCRWMMANGNVGWSRETLTKVQPRAKFIFEPKYASARQYVLLYNIRLQWTLATEPNWEIGFLYHFMDQYKQVFQRFCDDKTNF